MATLENMQAKIARLQAQAEALAAKQSSGVIAKIRDLMEKHGLTVADIEAHIGAKKRGRKPGAATVAKPAASAKYRDPKSGATWTGHGRAPAWIASAKDRTKFLVDGRAPQLAIAAKKPAKAGNYVKGPQAPKYRDPKSGATWSGRGPAPAWLAGAKDRSKFLIVAAKEGTPGSKAISTTKATAKKAVGKKPAAKEVKAVKKPALVKKVAVRKTAAKKTVERKAPARQAPQNPVAAAPTSDSASAPVVA
ncbi:UNVERIFIED_ORG: DNA-binding protein H-NS [Burkholderia sp. CF145]|uniref:H-NS histone family protein n=1 Tax=Paraburkholderia hospita TaxID=169430 RepID=UPI000271AE07|nr:H-NS histone family protein [Paraburkholderia hospita]EUC16973.1 histone family protein nucleoid-structuring protein H-NS [Burkholderia sp. BT03]SKD03600.1 DNA-binding protein H-NS [Paraburkholderia hospita]